LRTAPGIAKIPWQKEPSVAVRIERRGRGAIDAQVEEAFLAEDALAIHEALEGTGAGGQAAIDLHKSRRSEPVALAHLATDIRSGRWRIELRGICWYDIRLLSHLGVSERDLGVAPAERDY
jgi:hypothetical protein